MPKSVKKLGTTTKNALKITEKSFEGGELSQELVPIRQKLKIKNSFGNNIPMQ